MPLQEMINSDMKTDEVITENGLYFGPNFEGMDKSDMLKESILDNISTDGLSSNTSLPTTSGVSTISKGQLISKRLFDVIVWTKNQLYITN